MSVRVCPVVVAMLLVLAFSSCSTSKLTKKSHFIEGMTESEYVERVLVNNDGYSALTAKMALSVGREGKSATKVNGTLRIKKGEVIQVSIAPLLGIEVARVELTPDGVLVVDRINKRYVKSSFRDIGALANVGLDFHALQSLFLNELFLPGKGELTLRDFSVFDVRMDTDGVVLSVKKKNKRLATQFRTQAPEALLKETCLGLSGTSYGMNWEYDDFNKLGQKMFPALMNVTVNGGEQPVKAMFRLSRLSTDSDWKTRTEVSKKYKKVEWEEILKMLLK